MTTPSERLRQARRNAGYDNAKAAADAFGWNANTYKSHENGKRGINAEIAERYAARLGVGAEWILLGKNPPSWFGKAGVGLRPAPMIRAPLLDWVDVKRYLTYPERVSGSDTFPNYIQVIAVPRIGARLFFLPVVGESMIAKPATGGVSFQPGDLVGFDPDAMHKPGDFVLVDLENEEIPVFRKYQLRGRDDKGTELIDLVPLNEDYPTERISHSNPGRIIARLVQHVKMF